jgi:hypothetical protein
MKKLLFLFFFALIMLLTVTVMNGQCTFTPHVLGDTVICINQQNTLSTETYDSYQWYARPYLSSDLAQPIVGANQQILNVTSALWLNQISVEVTQNGCTERSQEVLLDGYTFASLTVMSLGNFINQPDGFFFCEGDTITLEVLSPYTDNVQWTRYGVPISGANQAQYAVTEPGAYNVIAATYICQFIDSLPPNILINTFYRDSSECTTSEHLPQNGLNTKIMYDASQSMIYIESDVKGSLRYEIFRLNGQLIESGRVQETGSIPVDKLAAGMYLFRLEGANKSFVQKFVVPK